MQSLRSVPHPKYNVHGAAIEASEAVPEIPGKGDKQALLFVMPGRSQDLKHAGLVSRLSFSGGHLRDQDKPLGTID